MYANSIMVLIYVVWRSPGGAHHRVRDFWRVSVQKFALWWRHHFDDDALQLVGLLVGYVWINHSPSGHRSWQTLQVRVDFFVVWQADRPEGRVVVERDRFSHFDQRKVVIEICSGAKIRMFRDPSNLTPQLVGLVLKSWRVLWNEFFYLFDCHYFNQSMMQRT